MKRGSLLNSSLSRIIAEMGHGDRLCLADAGLPIPLGCERVDLAVRLGLPSFLDVLDTVLEELWVERVILAEEIKGKNASALEGIQKRLEEYGDKMGLVPEISYVTHQVFKDLIASSRGVVRTGEGSPYCNILLESGVVF